MIQMDAHGQTVTDEELAVVAAAALAAAGESAALQVTDPAHLDDTVVAAVAAALAAAGISLLRPEPPLPVLNTAWRRSPYEQSIRPRWR